MEGFKEMGKKIDGKVGESVASSTARGATVWL
jgi:hypothetical protein